MSATTTVLGCICIYISSSLSSAAGVGGGSLNVPILLNIFGFSYQKAVVMSLCALMGNYLLQVLINLERRHPSSPQKPMIYYDAVLLLLPSELGGSNLGVLLSNVFPASFDYILALLVLIIAGVFTWWKAMHVYEQEVLESIQRKSETTPILHDGHSREDDPLLFDPNSHAVITKRISTTSANQDRLWPRYLTCWPCVCCDSNQDKDSDSSSDDESNNNSSGSHRVHMRVPVLVISVILGVWVFYVTCYAIMRSFSTCSLGYSIILALIYVLLLGQLCWGIRHLMNEQRLQPSVIAEGDIIWTHHTLWLCPIAFGIGILTAVLGIGGGELFGPLMLKMKILPLVSSSTTSFMSLLNTGSSVVHYLTLGEVDLDYGLLLFVIGALGGITGRIGALIIATKYNRISVVIFALFAVIALSFIIYTVYLIKDSDDLSFGAFCS